MLLRQGHYRNVTGEVGGSPTPDRTKVKRVFPWEERPRHAPGRMFPEQEAPLPAAIFVRSPPTVSATPEKKATLQSPMPSPLVGFPPSFQSHHPWDGASVLQRHANKFTRPAPSPSPLAPAFEDASKKLLERSDTNSHDGDVEDEIDSEEEAPVESRSPSSSVVTTKRGLQHRSIGVQTDTRELRDEGVQVTAWVAEMRTRPKAMGVSLRRHWPPSTGTGVVPPVMATDVSTGVEARAGRSSSVPKAEDAAPTPTGGNLPLSDSPRSSSPPDVSVRTTSTTPKPRRVGTTSPPSASSRKSPGDVQARRGSRVWDPARGVELFKRGSEEVLARFLKMGSWEERT